MGWENVFHCEWNPFGKKILNYYWPNAISYDDITKTDFTKHRGTIDVLSGGFPCQPYSVAGKRKGKDDERHLWPHMRRAIREIQPKWVVGENVLGLVSWNDGLVFEEVQADLESEGYEVQPFILPAAGVNAPHQRYRVWFVAYSDNARGSSGFGQVQGENGEVSKWNNHAESCDADSIFLANSTGERLSQPGQKSSIHKTDEGQRIEYGRLQTNASNSESERHEPRKTGSEIFRAQEEQGVYGGGSNRYDEYPGGARRQELNTATEPSKQEQRSWSNHENWANWPTQSPVCDGDDGISFKLDGITFSKWRNESIKGGGNAVVPQLVHQIFKTIEQYVVRNKK